MSNIDNEESNSSEEYSEKEMENEEIYSLNKERDRNYKAFKSSIYGRVKYAAVYNIFIFIGMYYYCRNLSYYRYKLGLNKTSIPRILFNTFMHITVPILIFVPNIFIIFGMHPIKYLKEKKRLEEELMSGEDYIFSLNQFVDFVEKEIEEPLNESLKTDK
jgi:hypothetical protein